MNSDQEEPVTHVTPRGGNVFADLGFDSEEAANLKLRSDLMMQLSAFIRRGSDPEGSRRGCTLVSPASPILRAERLAS